MFGVSNLKKLGKLLVQRYLAFVPFYREAGKPYPTPVHLLENTGSSVEGREIVQ